MTDTSAARNARPKTVRLLTDAEAARALLLRDPPLGAWPLCALGPSDWPHVRFWIDQATDAALWVFDHPWWGGSVQAFGEPAALDAVVRAVRMPARAFVRMPPAARSSLTARFRFDWLAPIVRMHATAETLALPPEASLVEPLSADDATALTMLYAHWPESRFRVGRLRQGYQYVGIRERGRLVAAAEHVLAAADKSVAIVQGVLVDPTCRGRGLGRAVTAGLTARLLEAGARTVVLDVREDNLSALAAYAAIGYQRDATLLAGPGIAR